MQHEFRAFEGKNGRINNDGLMKSLINIRMSMDPSTCKFHHSLMVAGFVCFEVVVLFITTVKVNALFLCIYGFIKPCLGKNI